MDLQHKQHIEGCAVQIEFQYKSARIAGGQLKCAESQSMLVNGALLLARCFFPFFYLVQWHKCCKFEKKNVWQ